MLTYSLTSRAWRKATVLPVWQRAVFILLTAVSEERVQHFNERSEMRVRSRSVITG
jgi:hypothetical protein